MLRKKRGDFLNGWRLPRAQKSRDIKALAGSSEQSVRIKPFDSFAWWSGIAFHGSPESFSKSRDFIIDFRLARGVETRSDDR
jgi:hypothetical protein